MNNNINEEEIVIRAQTGDEEAFTWLVRKYEKLIYYIVMQRVSDSADAMDIVQETLIEVKKSISQLHEPRFFKAWLNKVAFSKISRFYEKRRDRILNQNEEQLLYKQSEQRYYMNPQQSFHYQNNKEILEACLQQLKEIYREVLVLQYFEEFSLAEIAVILDIPEGTVKSRINVAKKELRKIVEQFQEQEQVQLTFESAGLEALLALVFAEQFQKLVYPGHIDLATGQEKVKMLRQNSFMNALLYTTVGLTLAAGTYYMLNHTSDPVSSAIDEEIVDADAVPFPFIIYRGEVITDARAAYSALYDAAYGQESVDTQEVKKLYDVLIHYGGAYASMAKYIEKDLEING